jgi:uncharacterized protein (DUF433 family)
MNWVRLRAARGLTITYPAWPKIDAAVRIPFSNARENGAMSLVIGTDPVPLQADRDGVLRVGKTRVTLDTVVSAFLEGATAEEIAQQYPSLDLADIYSVLGYYLRRRPELDAYLHERRERAADVLRQNESRHDPSGVRERLLARRAGKP